LLYLIGGAPRAGKTILARRILAGHRIAYFSLDVLMSGIANAMPERGIKVPDPALERARPMWPLVRAMALNLIESGDDYLIEGDVILPEHVAELRRQFAPQMRSCFLGYASIDPATKMHAIRRYASAGDWTLSLTDAYLLKLTAELRDFSAYLRDQSAQHGLSFFDESAGFAEMLDQALAFLCRVAGG
jgi:2-phosphoglycerate kinase